MAEYPFIIALTGVMGANGRITLSYQTPSAESYEISDLIFVATGAYDLYGLRSSNGLYYSNASENNPIKSTHLKVGGQNYNSLNLFKIPLIVEKGQTLYLDLKDTSGAGNTVYMSLSGIRKV